MKKFLTFLFLFLLMLVSPVHAISFSPLDLIQQDNNSTGALSSVLEKYNPEDFIECSITGSPEVVRDKSNTFRVNAEVKFDTEKYYSRFIPEITEALDKLADRSRNASGYLLELYDNGAFGPKYYSFNPNNAERVSELLSKFRQKALRVKGIKIELQDANMRTIHEIPKLISIQYFVFESSEGNKSIWTISPSIINFTDNKRTVASNLVTPIEFEIPASILPNVKNMRASLLSDKNETSRRQGWLGAAVVDLTQEKADSLRLGTTEGAMINSVARGGAAERAGLKHGDVILSLNGERVINGITFAQKIGTFKEGDVIIMMVNRDRKTYNLRITLGARPQ